MRHVSEAAHFYYGKLALALLVFHLDVERKANPPHQLSIPIV